ESVAAGEGLFEKPPGLERFAQDEAQHLGMPRVGHRVDPRLPSIDEGLHVAGVFFNQPLRRALATALTRRGRRVRQAAAKVGDRRGDPGELSLLAVDYVLIGV